MKSRLSPINSVVLDILRAHFTSSSQYLGRLGRRYEGRLHLENCAGVALLHSAAPSPPRSTLFFACTAPCLSCEARQAGVGDGGNE